MQSSHSKGSLSPRANLMKSPGVNKESISILDEKYTDKKNETKNNFLIQNQINNLRQLDNIATKTQ